MEEKKKSRELISERDSPPFGRSIAETFALKLPRFRDAPAARADCETIRGHNAGADVRDIWTRCTVNYGESFKFRNPFVDGHGIAEFLIHPPRHNGRRSILPSPPPFPFFFFLYFSFITPAGENKGIVRGGICVSRRWETIRWERGRGGR